MRDLPDIVADYDTKMNQVKSQMAVVNNTSGAGERIDAIYTLMDKVKELQALYEELVKAEQVIHQ